MSSQFHAPYQSTFPTVDSTRIIRRVSLIVEGTWHGEFYSPCHMAGSNYNWYCHYCGEVFASRTCEAGAEAWNYIKGVCSSCRKKYPSDYQTFFIDAEQYEETWQGKMLPVLAAEFLFNFPQLGISQ